ncbi:high mobility group box domain-containing protein, partial [Mycena olivaceomarginata]
PRRALSAYMFFSQEWRDTVKAENPDAGFGVPILEFCFSAYLTLARAGDIGRLLGAKWKELDEEGRKPYVEQAAKDKMRAEEEKRVYEVRRVSVQGRC